MTDEHNAHIVNLSDLASGTAQVGQTLQIQLAISKATEVAEHVGSRRGGT